MLRGKFAPVWFGFSGEFFEVNRYRFQIENPGGRLRIFHDNILAFEVFDVVKIAFLEKARKRKSLPKLIPGDFFFKTIVFLLSSYLRV